MTRNSPGAQSPPDAADGAPQALGEVLLLNLDVERDLPGFDRLLRPAGYRVRACPSLAQARDLVARIEPVAGLLHLGTPDDPPVRTVEALLEARPGLRLIALVEPSEAARAQLAPLIRGELIYDYHTLPL